MTQITYLVDVFLAQLGGPQKISQQTFGDYFSGTSYQITQGTTPETRTKKQTENNTDGQHSTVDWIYIGQDSLGF